MSGLNQLIATTGLNFRNLPGRLGASLAVIGGVAGVVGVLVCVLAMSAGFARTVRGTGRTDRVMILSTGAISEALSIIPQENVNRIVSEPGIALGPRGLPIASAEVLDQLSRPSRRNGRLVNVTLRGVGPSEPLLRPEIHMVAGRLFRPGLKELIVGRAAERQFLGLQLGDRVPIHNTDWTVVGIYASSPAATHDSEVMTDAVTLTTELQRNGYQSVTVRIDRPDSFRRLQSELAADSTLSVVAHRETDYFADQSRTLSTVLKAIAYFVGGLMAIGALCGALNTLYSAVSNRTVEIATLRALGFGAWTVVISVLAEALLLALLGSAVGALGAWALFNGHTTDMLLFGSVGQQAFSLVVTPAVVITGICWACAIGLIGGLLAARRAVRLPVAASLHPST